LAISVVAAISAQAQTIIAMPKTGRGASALPATVTIGAGPRGSTVVFGACIVW
jgi:hypothetical protein